MIYLHQSKNLPEWKKTLADKLTFYLDGKKSYIPFIHVCTQKPNLFKFSEIWHLFFAFIPRITMIKEQEEQKESCLMLSQYLNNTSSHLLSIQHARFCDKCLLYTAVDSILRTLWCIIPMYKYGRHYLHFTNKKIGKWHREINILSQYHIAKKAQNRVSNMGFSDPRISF